VTEFSQANSPLQVFTPLPDNTLLATRLVGREAMGDTFEFTVSLVAKLGTSIDFSQLVGKFAYAVVSLPGGASRTYHGMIWEFWQDDNDGVFDHYTMVLRPRITQLGLVKRSRVFQNQSANQIFAELLAPLNTPAGWTTQQFISPLPIRVYCTQYRETDLKFLRRLCSESGVTYYWIHRSGDHCINLIDNTTINAPDLGPIPYQRQASGTLEETGIRSWRLRQCQSVTSAQVVGSQFEVFNQELQATTSGPAAITAGSVPLKPFGFPSPWQEDELSASRYFDSVTASGGSNPDAITNIYSTQSNQSKIAAFAGASGSVRAFAVGDCCQLTPGHSFTLTGHPNQSGEWLVVSVEHTVEVEGRYWAGEAPALKTEARAECAPLSLQQHIWPLVPKPRIASLLTAIVIGPENNEIFVDQYGRVQVRFWWDRDNSTTSCWIRVAQSWAGNGWGACFWPRVGHEVVVGFENGDPDRPIIVGSVYNSTNMPPYPLPASQFIAGWKSLTEGGDPTKNFHQILMSDDQGAEVVHIHAESMFIVNQESIACTQRPSASLNLQG
jgi:type VI secretion system secreted protein VgrG